MRAVADAPHRRTIAALGTALAGAILVACGGSGSASAPSAPHPAGAGQAASNVALSAEAQSAATGDIPDNQVFLTWRDRAAGYALRYPEGWARQGAGNDVTFRDKNNLIHVLIAAGAVPTASSVTAELTRERAAVPSLTYRPASAIAIAGAPVVKASYTTVSAPSPVTGKRVRLLVDRYVFAHAGKVATLDLGTPRGVDNVDAYRMISESFRWQ
jgi:hypothetical protein